MSKSLIAASLLAATATGTMSFEKMYMFDEQKAKGVWTNPDTTGASYLVAQWDAKVISRIKKLKDPFRHQFENNTAPADLEMRLFAEAIADLLLLGWKNLKIGGVEIPYTKETAMQLLAYPAFANRIVAYAQDKSLFDIDEEKTEAEIKN